jgi:hypothetical protein
MQWNRGAYGQSLMGVLDQADVGVGLGAERSKS